MASALERMIEAVGNTASDCPDEENFKAVARAVLMAVRGVDGHGIEMKWWSERIVDAILNEKDATND